MIPVAVRAEEVDTLPGEEVEFSIGDARWVMRSLSKLYSNAILATIREYSTNARDAHVEAGNDDPIIVTIPTSIYDRFFVVQDFGVGMSLDTLKNKFTKFGVSTKRESNDANGMLGFGCKSALAYTDSFTVESVQDGMKSTVLIARKPDWSITLKVLSHEATDEPNGTKVTIPVADHHPFGRIANDFYRFWTPGTVLVNGAEPTWAVGEQLDDNLYYSTNPGTSYVVMGNVGYRIVNSEALFRNRGMNSISFVAYVPNGSVEFTPNREDLEYTDHTKKTLHGVIDNFEKKMLAKAKAEIDGAQDYFDAYTKYTFWSRKLGKGPFGDLEFKGEKFIDDIAIEAYRYRPSEYRYNMYQVQTWQVSEMSNTLVVYGVTGSPSSHHKSRSKDWRGLKGIKASYILFTEKKVDCVWIDPSRQVDWETVKNETKKPRQYNPTNRPKRIAGTFDYYTKEKAFFEKEVPDTQNLYYITAADSKNYEVSTVLRLLDDDAVVVKLSVNRINKFKRDYPQVKEFVTEFTKRVELDGSKFIDANTREALELGEDTRAWLQVLPVNEIKDPEFARLLRLTNESTNDKLAAYHSAYRLASAMKMRYNFKQHNITRSNNSLLDKYPLLNYINRYYTRDKKITADLVGYINAKYGK